MERAVLRFPNPPSHVMAIASESTGQRGVALAEHPVKGLHRPTFGYRDPHLSRSSPSRRRRLPKDARLSYCAFELGPEGLRFSGCHLVRAWTVDAVRFVCISVRD